MQGLSYFPVSLYIATFTRSLSDQFTATVVLALFNVSAVLGQVVLGHLTDRFPYPSIMVVSAVGSALGAFLLWGFASTAVYLYFFAIVFGVLVSPSCFRYTLTNNCIERWIFIHMAKLCGRVCREQTRICGYGFLRHRVL